MLWPGDEATRIDGRPFRSIWPTPEADAVEVIDQTALPHRFATRRIADLDTAVEAIRTMVVRGAPLIGATAAHGLALALRRAGDDSALESAYRALNASRPTAVNLRHALGDVRVALTPPGAAALNPAFDVTPAESIDGLITDRGIVAANAPALASAFGRAAISAWPRRATGPGSAGR